MTSCAAPRTPAAPLARRPSNRRMQSSASRSIASSRAPKRSLSIALVSATAVARGGVEAAGQLDHAASRAPGATTSVAKPWPAPRRRRDLAGQEQAPGGALAEQLGQQQGAGVGRDQADADLGRGEANAVGAHAQVALGRELERAADAHAVDGGDDRHRAPPGRRASGAGRPRRRRPRRAVGLDRGGEEVVAGREVLARAAQRRCSARPASAPAASIASAIRDHRLEVPGVAAVLAVPAHHAGAAELGRWSRSSGDAPSSRASHGVGGSASPRAVRRRCGSCAPPPAASRSPAVVSVDGAPSAACSSPSASSSSHAGTGASTSTRSGGWIGSPSATTAVAAERRAGRQHGADRLRVHVDGLHAQHVVAAAVDADARRGAPARARRGPHARRGRPSGSAAAARPRGEVGPDELAARAVLELAPARRVSGSTELDHGVVAGRQVQALALRALAGHRRPDVAHAEACRPRGRPRRPRSRARTAARPAPGSPAVTMWRRPSARGLDAGCARAARPGTPGRTACRTRR